MGSMILRNESVFASPLLAPASRQVHCSNCLPSRNRSGQRWFPTRSIPRRRHIRILAADATRAKLSDQDKVKLRSEAEAPFRALRLVLYSFFVVSASIGSLLAVSQLIGDLGNSRPLTKSLQNIGIDVTAAAFFGWLASRDWKARQTQMARLTREENLGALQVELANRKRTRLSELRSFARVVVVAGTSQQVEGALSQAEPLREDLLARGILIVPLPIFKASGSSTDQSAAVQRQDGVVPEPASEAEMLKWKARPLQEDKWRDWFSEQMRLAGASPDRGLYVGLRLDGRVRASGAGSPPWQAFVAQIAPLTGQGAWTGFFDVFDGRI